MIFVYIALALVALIILIFSIKVQITAVYDESFTLDVKWLFIKLRIYPEDEEKKKRKEEKKAKKNRDKKKKPKKESKEKPQRAKSNIFKDFYENQGFSATVALIRTAAAQLGGFFKAIYKAFIIENLTLLLKISQGDDPAQTAVKYGKVCSAVYPSMGFICSNMRVRGYDVNVVPDFICAQNTAIFKLSLSVRPIRLTSAAVVLAFGLLFKVLLKLLKGGKKNNKSTDDITKGGISQ